MFVEDAINLAKNAQITLLHVLRAMKLIVTFKKRVHQGFVKNVIQIINSLLREESVKLVILRA